MTRAMRNGRMVHCGGGVVAAAVAERIRGRVAALAIATTAGPVSVTVSIGCAAFDGDQESTERTADDRLYPAKALGRNRVVLDDAAE